MFSALFGKKKGRKGTAPWDELRHGGVTIPVWRSRAKDGQSRFVFGISRAYEKSGDTHYAKTYEIQNIRDILYGIEKLGNKLIEREDVPLKDRQTLARMLLVLERVFSSPEMKSERVVNGHGEPTR